MNPDERLIEVLDRAQTLGFLGPGSVAPHIEHSRRYSALLTEARSVLDLGSGGGLPGLVLVQDLPEATIVLLDARQGRVDALSRAIGALDARGRARAVCAQAEVAGHDVRYRGQFDVVVARLFGPLSWTLECAAGFVRLGGLVVVSSAFGSSDVAVDLDGLGLEPDPSELAGGTDDGPWEGLLLRFRSVKPPLSSVPRKARRP
jgi:16S rRNA (guanine527-N7)-methyltransferase